MRKYKKKSNKENNPSRSESPSLDIFRMICGDESNEEMDMTDEEELDNTKLDKDYKPKANKRRHTSETNHSSSFQDSLAMSENLNILNQMEEKFEPIAKKKYKECNEKILDSKYLTDQIFLPVYKIFYKKISVDIEIITQIYVNQKDMYKNLEILKLKLHSKFKQDPEEAIVSFQPKQTKNYVEIDKDLFFFVGQRQMNLFKIGSEGLEFSKSLKEFKIYIYESVYQYSQVENQDFKFSYSSNPLKRYSKLIEMYEREYFVLLSNYDHSTENNTELKNYFFKVEKNELNDSLLRLSASKHVSLVIDKIENSSNLIKLNLNVFLSDKCRQDDLIESNPSFIYFNSRASMDIHYVMTHYYLSRMNLKINHGSWFENHKANSKIDDQSNDDFFNNPNVEEKEITNINENLFDLIYEFHQNDSLCNKIISCSDNSVIQNLSCLRPNLRPYQIKAIKWMLYKENFSFKKIKEEYNEKSEEIHPLYIKIINEQNEIVYYHKYFGVITKNAPLKIKSLPGGILADEMGLGKTLEILTLLMINTRNDMNEQEFVTCEIEKNKKELNKKSFSCLCGNTPESLQIDSFKRNTHINDPSIYQCVACLVWTHIKCVNYSGKRDEFLCLECCTKVPPIKSGCTLIVTPSIISHQWADEIRKHVDKKLKVLVYKGTNGGFVQPRDLASLDICITTYDVLSNELSHVFAIENQRSLRKAKRFSNIPSPLICVEWWRICLDEAQMVHSTNSRCAEMANRLKAINRWCVTGTPIGRSLGDLHGLFAFIREDPYTDKKWFKYCLFETFQSGEKLPMVKAVSNVLWRTSKRFVEDQINIPKQTEICYWLDFSPFEAHLYQRVLDIFRENRKNAFKNTDSNNTNSQDINNDDKVEKENVDNFFSKYSLGNVRIDEVDRHVIDQLLAPLIDLRLACSHPQLVLRKRTFMTQNTLAKKKEKLLTMEKSLQILMKKTQNECDNIFRTMTMHSNAIAGLYILENQIQKAIETYQKILDSEKDYDLNVNLDLLQKVHTFHNYIDVLKMNLEEKKRTGKLSKDEIENFDSQIELLSRQLKECEKLYKLTFEEKKMKDETEFTKTRNEILPKLKLKNNLDSQHMVMILELLETIQASSMANDFWEQISKEFPINNYFTGSLESAGKEKEVKISYSFCGQTIKTINEIELIFTGEMDKIFEKRDELLEKLDEFSGDIKSELVVEAACCHLRKEMPNLKANFLKKNQKCRLCKSDQAFNAYAKHLFSNSIDAVKLLSKPKKNENESEDEFDSNDLQISRTTSDLEKFLKLLNSYSKSEKKLNEYSNKIKDFLELYGLLKIEFQHTRHYWISISTLINSMDELDMAKTRLRFIAPGEKNQKLDYIIEPSMSHYHFMRHSSEQKETKTALSKKLGQLVYLKHSLKTFSLVENEENTELCPICQCNLGFEWFIISCGHLFCKDCYMALLSSENSFIQNQKRYIRCALCRENCSHEESHLVSTKRQEDLSESPKHSKSTPVSLNDNNYKIDNESLLLKNIKIKGECNSAKVEGVVKCLVKILKNDINAKCLVFSENLTMLELIIDLLKANSINYLFVKDNYSFQKKIDEFKRNIDVNVLLMPYSFGANGLNIIEATHVLLVEPTLNKSQEVQAIGRVHRIGQTKPTFVYRFMIKNSIEEHVYSMFKSNTSYSSTTESAQNYDQPVCSKYLDDFDKPRVKEDNFLKVNDIKKLFLTL